MTSNETRFMLFTENRKEMSMKQYGIIHDVIPVFV